MKKIASLLTLLHQLFYCILLQTLLFMFVVISGGYRLFDVKVADGDNKVDFKLKGPFLMVRAGW